MMKLETPRLILRDYELSDLEAVHRYSCDPFTVRYMLWGPNTRPESLDFLKRSIEESTKKPRISYDLAIIEKSSHQLIGGVSLIKSGHEAEIGWILNQTHWGKGMALEAAWALIRFGFEGLNLERILATCDYDNTPSHKLMSRCGMTLVSIQKEIRKSRNMAEKNHDQIMMELKKADFYHQVETTHQQ